jgi:hypothetical protein
MIAARQIFLGCGAGGGGWKNPYITDGLIAMWDGEWNAGGGVHDPNATTWVDLSGNGNDAIPNAIYPRFDNNSLVFTGLSNCFWTVTNPSSSLANISQSRNYELTLESAYNFSVVGQNAGIINLSTSATQRGYSLRFYSSKLYATFSGPQYGPYGSLSGSFAMSGKDDGVAGSYKRVVVDLYIDGASVDSTHTAQDTFGAVNSRVWLGNTGANDGVLIGHLYTSRIYNRILTAAEIAANHAIDKARLNLP